MHSAERWEVGGKSNPGYVGITLCIDGDALTNVDVITAKIGRITQGAVCGKHADEGVVAAAAHRLNRSECRKIRGACGIANNVSVAVLIDRDAVALVIAISTKVSRVI